MVPVRLNTLSHASRINKSVVWLGGARTVKAVLKMVVMGLGLGLRYALQALEKSSGDKFGSDMGFGGGGEIHHMKRDMDLHHAQQWKRILFPVLIPVLVLLSGVFAGLTLGYMSLDETQLNVLSISGTPKQREYANKIKPIRQNGHMLLVTLLLANMIVNETLPVIADPVLGGGVQGVVVSTVLIVIFAEIIPQSLFTRHGLYLGAKMAWFTKILIYGLGIVSWPVAKLLEFVLGKHHGIIYRRAELKELIAMHDSLEAHGGDLKTDTVTIIGATLDLQEKVVKQAMTPINDVFMLSIESKLDYDLLKKICQTGHSRVPVYEEVEVPLGIVGVDETSDSEKQAEHQQEKMRVKKIVGIFLVKHCVLLDPKDATPLRNIPLNKVPFVPNNKPLLSMLDIFQEGKSHMAIVSRFSVEKAQSVKKAVKRGLTQRLRARVGMDSSSSSSDNEGGSDGDHPRTTGKSVESEGSEKWNKKLKNTKKQTQRKMKKESPFSGTADYDLESGLKSNSVYHCEKGMGHDGDTCDEEGERETLKETAIPESKTFGSAFTGYDYNSGETTLAANHEARPEYIHAGTTNPNLNDLDDEIKKNTKFQFSSLRHIGRGISDSTNVAKGREQSMPDDAVLAEEDVDELLQGIDPAVMPLGIITLEDVLEELIGEEIYDEFDPEGAHGDPCEYEFASPRQVIDTDSEIVPPTMSTTSTTHMVQPQLVSNETETSAVSDNNVSSAFSSIGSMLTPKIGKPKLKSLGSLGFLVSRSRSAPPTRRSEVQESKMGEGICTNRNVVDSGKVEVISHKNFEENEMVSLKNDSEAITFASPEIFVPKPSRDTHGPPFASAKTHSRSFGNISGLSSPSPHISGTAAAFSAPHSISQPAGSDKGGSISTKSPSADSSRAGSPVLPLEAILLERNRRRLAGAYGSSGLINNADSASGMGIAGAAGHGLVTGVSDVRNPSLGQESSAVGGRSGNGNGGTKGFKSSPLRSKIVSNVQENSGPDKEIVKQNANKGGDDSG